MCFGLQHKYEKGEKNGDELVKSKFWTEAMGSNSPIGCMLQNCAKGLPVGISMKTNQYGRLIWDFSFLIFGACFAKLFLSIFQVWPKEVPRKRLLLTRHILHSRLCDLVILFRRSQAKYMSCSEEIDVRWIIWLHQSKKKNSINLKGFPQQRALLDHFFLHFLQVSQGHIEAVALIWSH